MEVTGEAISEIVQSQFDRLPQKRKPRARDNVVQEWVPLSGIVAQDFRTKGKNDLKCVALGTGMKCLPRDKLGQARGVVLHDWHAEIVAVRSFNLFLLRECQSLALSGEQRSEYIRRRTPSEVTDSHFQPFALNEDISLHMYCSEAPCGDASMELTIASQKDTTPWPLLVSHPLPSSSHLSSPPSLLQGRGYFSELGIVRRKPSRRDAPPTLSKSCSDKLALKQCTSLLSAPVSALISPSNVYLSSFTLPSSQFSSSGCLRAFSPDGRMAPLKDRQWGNGYRFHPFRILTTRTEFAFSRRGRLVEEGGRSGTAGELELVPSNLAAGWTPYGEESLIGGVLQGRRQFDPRGASVLCRKSMWKLAAELAALVAVPAVSQTLSQGSYELVKSSSLLEARIRVKDEVKERALRGWITNEGDDFSLDVKCCQEMNE